MEDYQERLDNAFQQWNDGHYENCVTICGGVMECILRSLLSDLRSRMTSINDEKTILKAEEKIGNGKTANVFGLGQLVGLYREADIYALLKRHYGFPMNNLSMIDFGKAVDWRNSVTHHNIDICIDEDHANQMFLWTKYLLKDWKSIMGITDSSLEEKEAEIKSTCDNCGAFLQDDWRYCPLCGRNLIRKCPNCGRLVKKADWIVCPYCETKLHELDSDEKLRAKHEYKLICRGIWADNVANPEERDFLDSVRKKLGLSFMEARELESKEAPTGALEYQTAVEALLSGSNEIDERGKAFLAERAKALGINDTTASKILNALAEIKAEQSITN